MNHFDPAVTASRVAEKNRVDHERAKADDCRGESCVLFVEKRGAPPLEKVSKKLERALSKKRSREGAEELHEALWPFQVQPGRPRKK